jgi:lipopolysaccharide heptosyltransferase I
LSEEPRKILIVRLSALGDVVRCLPALTALRNAFPQAHIGWIVERPYDELVEGHPDLDEVIVLPRKEWARRAKNPIRLPALPFEISRFFRALKKKRYDVAIDFQGNLRSALVTRWSGAPRRIGLGAPSAKESAHVFYTEKFIPPAGVHRLTWNMLMLYALGIKDAAVEWHLPENAQEKSRAREFLSSIRRTNGPLVVIHPGTSKFGEFKRWPAERFAETARRLHDESGAAIVVTGGPGERELCEAVAGGAAECAVVAPPTSLKALAALIGEADLFVGADTGPMHIAAAAGVPVVAVFGPKDPAFYGPYGEGHEVVTAEVSCRPCGKRRCKNPMCVTEVTVESVVKSAKKILAR